MACFSKRQHHGSMRVGVTCRTHGVTYLTRSVEPGWVQMFLNLSSKPASGFETRRWHEACNERTPFSRLCAEEDSHDQANPRE